jgi:hypothetical protein
LGEWFWEREAVDVGEAAGIEIEDTAFNEGGAYVNSKE